MKLEPLKRKLYTPSNIEYKGIAIDKPFLFRLDDLKSAVKWLKLKEYVLGHGKCTRCGNYHTYREHRPHKDREQDQFICLNCNLNEAFEDVIKNGKNKI